MSGGWGTLLLGIYLGMFIAHVPAFRDALHTIKPRSFKEVLGIGLILLLWPIRALRGLF